MYVVMIDVSATLKGTITSQKPMPHFTLNKISLFDITKTTLQNTKFHTTTK